MKKYILPVLLSVSTMTGCSAPGAKPDEVGFIGATGNINSGEFDRQLKRKKLKLLDSKAKVQSEKNRRVMLEQQAKNSQDEKKRLERELTYLKNSNNELERIINNKRTDNKQKEIEKRTLINSLNSLKRKIAAVEKKKPSKPNKHYQEQIDQLKKEIAQLRKAALEK